MWAEALFAISTFLFLSFNGLILIERKRGIRFFESFRVSLDKYTIYLFLYSYTLVKKIRDGRFAKEVRVYYGKLSAWVLKRVACISERVSKSLHKKAKDISKDTSKHLVEMATHKKNLK